MSEQVSTLMKALATLTEEKSRIEAHFQADKRALKKERDELQETLENHKLEWKNVKTKLKEQVDEVSTPLKLVIGMNSVIMIRPTISAASS